MKRKEIREILDGIIPGCKFSLRKVSFMDLARDDAVFMDVTLPEGFMSLASDYYERRDAIIKAFKEHKIIVKFKGDLFS